MNDQLAFPFHLNVPIVPRRPLPEGMVRQVDLSDYLANPYLPKVPIHRRLLEQQPTQRRGTLNRDKLRELKEWEDLLWLLDYPQWNSPKQKF
jgi:hypothetical protein